MIYSQEMATVDMPYVNSLVNRIALNGLNLLVYWWYTGKTIFSKILAISSNYIINIIILNSSRPTEYCVNYLKRLSGRSLV